MEPGFKHQEIRSLSELTATLDFVNRMRGVGSVAYEMDAVKDYLRSQVPVTAELEVA